MWPLRKRGHPPCSKWKRRSLDNYSKAGADAHGIELTNGNLVTFAGGIPLRDVDGQIIGSIGVSGGQVAQDYAVAQSGESALKA